MTDQPLFIQCQIHPCRQIVVVLLTHIWENRGFPKIHKSIAKVIIIILNFKNDWTLIFIDYLTTIKYSWLCFTVYQFLWVI